MFHIAVGDEGDALMPEDDKKGISASATEHQQGYTSGKPSLPPPPPIPRPRRLGPKGSLGQPRASL